MAKIAANVIGIAVSKCKIWLSHNNLGLIQKQTQSAFQVIL
jgi:hypothetical protein